MTKTKLNSEENNLLATLRKIKYNSKPTVNTILHYLEENRLLIDSIETVSKYPSQKAILFSHFKNEFEIGDMIRVYKLPSDLSLDEEKIKSSIKLTCSRITNLIKQNKVFKLSDDAWCNKFFSIYIIFVLQENARLGNKKVIRRNSKDIQEISSIFIDKTNKLIKTINIPDKLNVLFETFLQNEINVPLVQPRIPKNGSWKNISNSLIKIPKGLEIEEMGFNITDLSTGEKIIIKSNKGDVSQYIDTMLNQKGASFLDSAKFDLSYIEHMKIRRNKGHTNYFNFSRNDTGAIIIENRSRHKDKELEKQLEEMGIFIDNPIIDTEKISQTKLIQQVIIRCFLSEKEYRLDVFKQILDKFNSYKIVKEIREILLYKCYGSIKCWNSSSFRTKTCPHCKKSNKIRWWSQGREIVFDMEEIIKELKNKLKKSKVKYRRIISPFYNKKYELHKIYIPNQSEISLFFNKKGLHKNILKDFSLCPRPLYCVNFRGEVKKFPEFLYQEDASDFIFRLFEKNEVDFVNFLKDKVLNKSLAEIQENSFIESLVELKKVLKNKELADKKKGNKYEYLTSNIFNYIFPISDKWGGKNLPDGIIGMDVDTNKEFIFWDAKRYDDTKLSNYASKRKKGVVKDIQYVLESLKKEDTYEDGRLKYYLFVTSSTYKEDFIRVQEKINKIIGKNKYIPVKKGKRKRKLNPYYKRLKEVRFCCMNIEELISLAEVFTDKDKRDRIQRSGKLGTAFERILDKNNGFIEKNNVISELNQIIHKKEFVPKKEEHKRKGLEILE